MKTAMKILAAVILCAALCVQETAAQSRKERKALFGNLGNFEVQTLKVGSDGTKFIKVWGYGKKVDDAIVQAKKNAVYACLFKGLPSAPEANATPAICRSTGTYDQHREYFDAFFETGGPYINYINITTDGVPSGQDRLKIKGGYKVGLYVQVMYDNLKDRMEEDGITRRLGDIF